MAEALGAAAAVAHFVEIAGKIVKLGADIYEQYRSAPQRIPRWVDEVKELQGIISHIEESPGVANEHIIAALKHSVLVSEKLCEILTNIYTPDGSFHQRTWGAVVGKAKEKEIANLFCELERIKSNITLAQLRTQDEIHSNVCEVQADVRNMRLDMSETRAMHSVSTDQDRCLQALFVTNPKQDRATIIDIKGDICDGTCEWILSTEEYQEWDATPPHLLWISAPPGMGKTFMAIYLSRHLESVAQSRQDTKVIYFFCDNKVKARNTATNILRGLLAQLIEHQPELISIMVPSWKMQADRLFDDSSFLTLWDLFEKLVRNSQATTVYCLIDALDECDDRLWSLLRKLGNLGQKAADSKMKILCFSRRYPEQIPESLESFLKMELDMMASGKADIQRYISQRVLELSRRKGLNPQLRDRIEAVFQDRSESTFLWVSFMAQDLEQKTVADIETALEQLPPGLSAVYERILTNILADETRKKTMRDMLGWILVAKRPLRIPELCEAARLSATANVGREELCMSLVKACGHLLQASRTEKDFWYNKHVMGEYELVLEYWRTEVTFLHQSAKDHLIAHSYLLPTDQIHEAVSIQMIEPLPEEKSSWKASWNVSWQSARIDTLTEFPLSQYTQTYWPLHFSQLSPEATLRVIAARQYFFQQDTYQRNLFVNPLWTGKTPIPVLHMASSLGLEHLVRWCLRQQQHQHQPSGLKKQHSRSINERLAQLRGKLEYQLRRNSADAPRCKRSGSRWPVWNNKTPLHMACENGQDATVLILLDAGADPICEEYGIRGETPFEFALYRCNAVTWRALAETEPVQRWLQQQARCQTSQSLTTAASQGNMTVCRFLVGECNWDVNHGPLQTPLRRALGWGHVELARILHSEYHARIDDRWDLLVVLSSLFGKTDLAPVLVQAWGLDINTTDANGCTVLCSELPAGNRLRCDTLAALIQAGADPGIANLQGCVFFHCAMARFWFPTLLCEHPEALRLMLRNGRIDINTRDASGSNVLHHAISHFKPSYRPNVDMDELVSAIGLLLRSGADPHLRDNRGRSSVDLFRRLLAKTQDDDDDDSALYKYSRARADVVRDLQRVIATFEEHTGSKG